MCLQPNALDLYSPAMGEMSGHGAADGTMAQGAVGIRNLLDIPHSAAVRHHAYSTTTRTLNLMHCPHVLDKFSTSGESQVKLILSCFFSGLPCLCHGTWLLLKAEKQEQESSLAELIWFSA